jgi:hypothetical protein
VTNAGEFLDRKQAYRRAMQQGQIDGTEFTLVPGILESVSFNYAKNKRGDVFGQFQPPAPTEAVDFLRTATDEQFREATKDFKGRYGGGPTGWAFEVGAQARTQEDLTALKTSATENRAAAKELMSAGGIDNLMKAQPLILKAQLAREAYEAATGTNLEGQPTDASVGFIRKYADPNYNPPMGQAQPREAVADLPEEQASKIPGASVHRPYATYARASTAGPDNPWVRSSADPERNADPSNANRALMIQFDTNIQSLGGKITRDEASEYYDKLYSGVRPGYARMEDFWEIPQWMGFAAHVLPDADMYVVRDMTQAKQFLNTAKYGHVLFSAMDVNAEAIKELAKDYNGKFDVGGYTAPGTFKDVPNVVWHNSMPEMAKALGAPYSEGVDYRHFVGADSIPRLTMSSGCKYKCAFCTIEKTVKAAPSDVVTQQANAIADLHTKLIYLNDKTFGQANNYQDLANLNEQVKARNPNFEGFVVQTTASQMLKLPADWLAKSGIKYVELGIESFNDPILRDIRKPATEAQMEASANKLRELGITLIPNVLIGLPGETPETYARTLDFLKKHSDIISHANIYNLAVYKDTELAKKITTASPGDYDENVREKTFYADPEVHRVFAGDLYSAGQGMLAQTPETLVRPKGEVTGQAQPEQQPVEHLNDIDELWPGGFATLAAQQEKSGIADETMPAGEPAPSEVIPVFPPWLRVLNDKELTPENVIQIENYLKSNDTPPEVRSALGQSEEPRAGFKWSLPPTVGQAQPGQVCAPAQPTTCWKLVHAPGDTGTTADRTEDDGDGTRGGSADYRRTVERSLLVATWKIGSSRIAN